MGDDGRVADGSRGREQSMTRDRTMAQRVDARGADRLLDARFDASAVDEVRRVIARIRLEFAAAGELTALIWLAGMFG
jgi:hypothetical protein